MIRALALALCLSAPAAAAPILFHEADQKKIAAELKRIHRKHKALPARIAAVSERFIGTPYRLGPLGEGPEADFDREPTYSFREADCTTFVEHVMALSLERELPKALKTLQRIRYKDGTVSYQTRNHFPEVDWLPQNVYAGFLKDITVEVAGEKAKTIGKRISKREWYAKKTLDDLQGFSKKSEKELRLPRLQALGAGAEDQVATIAYLPLEELPALLSKIPSGTIANLVREDQPEMPVLITHQVLVIDGKNGKLVRHARSGGAVEDAPALQYFYRYWSSKWRLLGLNLNRIQAPR